MVCLLQFNSENDVLFLHAIKLFHLAGGCYGKNVCQRQSRSARKTCIDKSALCDTTANCPLSDDEQGCGKCTCLGIDCFISRLTI